MRDMLINRGPASIEFHPEAITHCKYLTIQIKQRVEP
jgi:hypothetical protein